MMQEFVRIHWEEIDKEKLQKKIEKARKSGDEETAKALEGIWEVITR